MQQMHKAPRSLGGVSFIRPGQGWPLIYLLVYLQLIQPRNALAVVDSQHCFLAGSLSYLFRREKFKAPLSAEGEACCILTLQPPPARDDLEREALNGPLANLHVCFVRPGRQGSGLT